MAITTTLAACNTNQALNGPDGATDLPSVLDDGLRYALSFIAQLRDGAAIPAGMIANFATSTTPAGWLKMNGALVSRTTYAALFAFASASGLVSEAVWNASATGSFSVGDGSTTFRLPDLRGLFVRGLDESRGVDVSRAFGVQQAPANVTHNHGVTDPMHNHSLYDPGHIHTGSTASAGDHQHTYDAPYGSGGGAQAGAPWAIPTPAGANTSTAGAHTHAVTIGASGTGMSVFTAATGISINNSGVTDGRPANQAYPFYIKA